MDVLTLPIILAWAALLVVQNASFTVVSRARNSGSDWYHGIAAVFSNGIWFVSQTFIVLGLVDLARTLDWKAWTGLAVLYVICTVTGSVLAGRSVRRWVEKGERRVGFYPEDEQEDEVPVSGLTRLGFVNRELMEANERKLVTRRDRQTTFYNYPVYVLEDE